MNKNMVRDLLGQTFNKSHASIGNDIEIICGGSVNCKSQADLGFFEVKSRKNSSQSYVTLGGLADADISDVIAHVYEKIQNIIFIEYDLNSDNSYTVTSITILFGLDKETFVNGLGRWYYAENHKRGLNLRITKSKLFQMFGTKIIQYTAEPQYYFMRKNEYVNV